MSYENLVLDLTDKTKIPSSCEASVAGGYSSSRMGTRLCQESSFSMLVVRDQDSKAALEAHPRIEPNIEESSSPNHQQTKQAGRMIRRKRQFKRTKSLFHSAPFASLCVWALLLHGTLVSCGIEARRAIPGTIVSKTVQPTKLPSDEPLSLYRWGNFGHEPRPLSPIPKLAMRLRRLVASCQTSLRTQWENVRAELTFSKCLALAARGFRSWVFWFFSKDCLSSIYEDRWHAERDPDAFFGNEGMWVSKGAHKDVVRRRIKRSKRNRQWVGLGYTPRLVWLVGVLMRGTFQCTAIPKVFNPSLTGWGAGTILGAKCTHQEWVAAFMIGWFGSEYYWRFLFGVNGPPYAKPGFNGIPVQITEVRNVRPLAE